jgi:hypothetical protein
MSENIEDPLYELSLKMEERLKGYEGLPCIEVVKQSLIAEMIEIILEDLNKKRIEWGKDSEY